jgi:hypothetical protein
VAKVEETQIVTASASEVWELIGGFNDLALWHPGVEESTLEDGGRTRHLRLVSGGRLIERLQSFSERERSYSYSIVEGPLPVAAYLSLLGVREQTDGNCQVHWSGEFIPEGASEQDATAIVRGIYRAGLESLRRRFGN